MLNEKSDTSSRWRISAWNSTRLRAWVHAVSHSSFKLRAGETLGIVGESGSGKSRDGERHHAPAARHREVTGKILFKGQDIMQMKTKDFNRIRGKEISMIFQDPMTSLNPLYTVGNQLRKCSRCTWA